MPRASVPVIGLTGFLGAGKTTLLNHLLRTSGARLGVIINDFGDINVDAALVQGQVDDAVSIPGGCLCCMTLDEGLDPALAKLARPRLRLDAILLEASGVAEPAALAHLIHSSSLRGVHDGGLIEVIDALECFSTIDTAPLPPARYGAASLVVINKIDEVEARERLGRIASITERIRARNERAVIVATSGGAIDPDLIFDVGAEEQHGDQLPLWEVGDLVSGAHHAHHRHAHSVSVAAPHPVSAAALLDLFATLPPEVYRLKGRLHVARAGGKPLGVLVNSVGGRIHLERHSCTPAEGELVAIGMGLDEPSMREMLGKFVSDAAATPGGAADRHELEAFDTLVRWLR